MGDTPEPKHGDKQGKEKCGAVHRKWTSSSNFARDHGTCNLPSLETRQRSAVSDSSSPMSTQQMQSQSRVNLIGEEIETSTAINDYLRDKFTADGYKSEDDAISYCPSLDKAKRMFDDCTLFKLTGCWTYEKKKDRYRTVVGWKCDMDRTFRFRNGSGKCIPQVESSLFARHHPLRCELVRASSSTHNL